MLDLEISSRTVLDVITEKRSLFNRIIPFLEQVSPLMEHGRENNADLNDIFDSSSHVSDHFLYDRNDVAGTLRFTDETIFLESDRATSVNFHLFPTSLYRDTKIADLHFNIDVSDPSGEDLRVVGALLRNAAGQPDSMGEPRKNLEDIVDVESISSLADSGFLVEKRDSPVADFEDFEGALRLQHAAMLFRHAKKGILIDPHLHSRYSLPDLRSNISARQISHLVDCIAITHTHGDHYDISTLMMFPLDLPIIVPKIPRASIICDDITAQLKAAGFRNVIELDWYDAPFVVGEMELFPLPFFGEQPLAYEPVFHPDLRNWGNTYVVRTPSSTTWMLVDSGNDYEGQMVEVAEKVLERIGVVDVVTGNLGTFSPRSPKYITGGFHYWMSLTPEQRLRFSTMRDHSLTLGVGGVAAVCHAAKAKHYLPYAHWWGDIAGHPRSELADLKRLSTSLKAMGSDTKVHTWAIGSRYELRGGEPVIYQHLKTARR